MKRIYKSNSLFASIFAVLFFVFAYGCSTSQTASPYRQTCSTDDDCLKDERCVSGVCIDRINPDGDEYEDLESEGDESVEKNEVGDQELAEEMDVEESGESLELLEVDEYSESLEGEVAENEAELSDDVEVEEVPEEEELEPPNNNSCENATSISVSNDWQEFDSSGATNSGISGITETCTGRVQGGADVFFKVHLEKDKPVVLSVRPSQDIDMDLSVAVLDSCGSNAECITGADARFPALDWVSFKPDETKDYYIVVGTTASAEFNPGHLDLYGRFQLLVAPANAADQCAECSDPYGFGFNFCGYGAGCYSFIYNSELAEKSCLRTCESDDDCGLLYNCRSVPVEENVSAKYCVPSYTGTNYATCSAIREMGSSCSDALPGGNDDDQCGADSLQVIKDAECVTIGIPPKSMCAIPCQGPDKQCPEGFSCQSVLLVGDFCLP